MKKFFISVFVFIVTILYSFASWGSACKETGNCSELMKKPIKVAVDFRESNILPVLNALLLNSTGNGNYRVYIPQNDTIQTDINVHDYGYFPDSYAEEAGYMLAGEATGTSVINFPKTVDEFFLFVPAGNSVKLDSIELIDKNGNTTGYMGYTADGRNIISSLITGNCPAHKFVFGQPDGIYSWLGKQYPELDHQSYFIYKKPSGIPPFRSIRINVSNLNNHPALFWDYYLDNINAITDTDKSTLESITKEIIQGYIDFDKNLILKHYSNADQEKISNDLDHIFAGYKYETTYGELVISGELPYAIVRFNPSYPRARYYIETDGSCSGGFSEIRFKKVENEWKVYHDYDGPHYFALNCLSRIGEFKFW